MNKSYGNGSKSDVERFLLNEVPGVTAFRIEEYGKGIVSVFVDGGLESDIAEALYQTMSAGIVMSGDISCTVNGTNIKFSRGAAPCDKKWEAAYRVGDKVRAPGTFEKVPEEEYQKLGGPVVNPTMNFITEVCKILEITPSVAQVRSLTTCLEDFMAPQYVAKMSGGDDAALKERIKAMLLKYPEDETFDDKIVNMTGPAMHVSELRASYPEEDVRAPLNSLYQSRAADSVLVAGTFQKLVDKVDEQAMSDLAKEMINYKSGLEDSFYDLKSVARQWPDTGRNSPSMQPRLQGFKQVTVIPSSASGSGLLSPGYGQQVPTSTTNETNLGFPLPTTPAIPGTVIWGDSPLILSGEALRAWGVALDNADYAAPEIKEDVECLPASPGWAPTDAFLPTKSPTTMYVCLSYGCPERAPSPSHEICYTCGKPMSGVMVEEKSDVITLNITCPAVSVSGPAPAGTTEHFVGATDSNVVTYFPGSVAYCDSI